MNEEKVNITIPADYNGKPIQIELREGQAPMQLDEVRETKVKRSGVITSAEEYALKVYARETNLQPGIVMYSLDPAKLYITLDEFPAHPHLGAIITGKAEINPEIKVWAINTQNTFSAKEVIAMIMKQAHNFNSKEEAKRLISLLRNFEATFTTEKKRADDRRGNVEDAFKQTIGIKQGEMPSIMNLNIPIFKGGTPVPITLEIELDQDDNDVVYSFYSLELESALRETAKEAILNSVDKLREIFVCIEEA